EATRPEGLAVYGEQQVLEALRKNMLDLLIISEDLDRVEVLIQCQNCGYQETTILDQDQIQSEVPKKLAEKCPKCLNQSLALKQTTLMLDKLIAEAEKMNVKVELVSSEHEEGEMFMKAFKGVAGFLRHRGGY
ncbi:MAG: hypothetical protein QXY50_00525, partial [Candidatus Caldarchaeum sp.]